MPSFIYLLYNAHKIREITLEVFSITFMGMSLALPFFNSVIIVLISSIEGLNFINHYFIQSN